MMKRPIVGIAVVAACVGLSIACDGAEGVDAGIDSGADAGADSGADSDTDSDVLNPCIGAGQGDPCDVPGMDGPECDFESNFLHLDEGHCDEGSGGDELVCDMHSVDCNNVEPPYCDAASNSVRERVYVCEEPEVGEANCALVSDLEVESCDDLAGSTFCGTDEENDVIYSSATFTCVESSWDAGCSADAPVVEDDCELYSLMCEGGACTEPPPCYEAEDGDPCDTGLPDHCEGNVLVFGEGTCCAQEMTLVCCDVQEDCAPQACIEDDAGAHCG
jgi:hypothetical protein